MTGDPRNFMDFPEIVELDFSLIWWVDRLHRSSNGMCFLPADWF